MCLQQPLHAVRRSGFLIGGECNDDVAVRPESFTLHAHQGHQNSRVFALQIQNAASIEEAVLLGQPEGFDRPTLAWRFDHVDMSYDEERTRASRSVEPRHYIGTAGLIRRGEQVHVIRREARFGEAVGDCLRRDPGSMSGGRVNLNERAQDLHGDGAISARRNSG